MLSLKICRKRLESSISWNIWIEKVSINFRVCFFHAVKQTDWDRKNKTASSQQANLQAQGGLGPIIKYRTEQSILIKDFHYEAIYLFCALSNNKSCSMWDREETLGRCSAGERGNVVSALKSTPCSLRALHTKNCSKQICTQWSLPVKCWGLQISCCLYSLHSQPWAYGTMQHLISWTHTLFP